METYKKEHLISRICAGYLRYPITDEVLRIHNPSLDINYEANELYCKVFTKSLNAGLSTDKNIYNLLIERGIWTEENEKNLILVLPKHIEYWKVEMYRAMFRSNDREKFRKYLDKAKTELLRLHQKRHMFDYATCEGIAHYARVQFIIENCTFTKENKLYDWDKSSPYLAMAYYQENIIAEEILRELAHTTPWDNIWATSKKNGSIFPKSGVELSQEQQRLIMWSSMYDSIREYPDCPSEDMVNDDDILDGWLIIKREEREANAGKAGLEVGIKNNKIANADEVYLVAQTIEDANKIDMLNSNLARNIKKQRFDYIKKKGEVNEAALPDVKQRFQMELTQALKGKMNGR